MTFEEFFKKKRIDLAALETGEPALFSEFKAHYEQMGEKSFDHTKKYWFNKTRRQFPLAPEVKTEKPHISNQVAEQTITESLSETVIPSAPPKMGFVPKFRPGNMPKPATVPDDKKAESVNQQPNEQSETPPQPKLGFVPKFRAGNMPKSPTPVEEKKEEITEKPITEESKENATSTGEKPIETSAPKPAYKPRFNMNNIPPNSKKE
jgi:hypothetical protein